MEPEEGGIIHLPAGRLGSRVERTTAERMDAIELWITGTWNDPDALLRRAGELLARRSASMAIGLQVSGFSALLAATSSESSALSSAASWVSAVT